MQGHVSSLLDSSAPSGSARFWRLATPAPVSGRSWRVSPVGALRLAILLLFIGQLGRIPLLATGTRDAPLLVNDLCIIVVLAVAGLVALHRGSFRIDAVGMLMIVFAVIGFTTALLAVPRFGLSGLDLLVSLAYLARWLVYFGLYLVVVNFVKERDVGTVWRTIEAMMLAFAVFGIVQAIFLPHFAQLVYPDSRVYIDWDEQGHRLVSTVLEPNIAGSMIVYVLLIQCARLSTGVRVPLWKPLIMLAALVATLSRSSFLGLAVGGIVILAVRGLSRRLLRFAALVAALLTVASPQLYAWLQHFGKLSVSDASTVSRFISWAMAWDVFADHPIFGVGFNTYGYVAEHYGGKLAGAATFSADGGFLFIAAMTGLVGVACYVAMLAIVVRRCRRVWRDATATADERGLAVGIAAATIAAPAIGLWVNTLLTPFSMELLWLFWGMTFAMSANRAPRPQGAAPMRLVTYPLST